MFNYAFHKRRMASTDKSKDLTSRTKQNHTKKYPKSSKLLSAPNYPYQNNEIVNCILGYDIDSKDVEKVYNTLKKKQGTKKKLKGKVEEGVEIGRPLTFSRTSKYIRRSSLKRPQSSMASKRNHSKTNRRDSVHILDKTVDIVDRQQQKENLNKNQFNTQQQKKSNTSDDYLGLMNTLIGNEYESVSKTQKNKVESPPTPNTKKNMKKQQFRQQSASMRLVHLVGDDSILEKVTEDGDESMLMDHIRQEMNTTSKKPPIEKPAWRQYMPGKYQNDGTFSWNDPRVSNYQKKMQEANEKMARLERQEKDAMEFVKKKRRVKEQRQRFKMQRQRNFLNSQHEPRVRAQVRTFVLGDKNARSSRPLSARPMSAMTRTLRPQSARGMRPQSARGPPPARPQSAVPSKRPTSARPTSARPSSARRTPKNRQEELECEHDWSSPEKAMNDIYAFETKIAIQRADEQKWTGSDTLAP